MARTWLRIRVDLLGGGGIDCDPAPGRIFLVGPSHTFEQFAEAIDAAFARWDLSHLHNFELKDGRLIGYPDDSFAPDLVWLDHAKLKVAKEVEPGEEFEYVFDLGDNWRHRCTVRSGEGRSARGVRDRAQRAGPDLGLGLDPRPVRASGLRSRRRRRRAGLTAAQAASLRWQTTAQPSSMNAMCSSGSRS